LRATDHLTIAIICIGVSATETNVHWFGALYSLDPDSRIKWGRWAGPGSVLIPSGTHWISESAGSV